MANALDLDHFVVREQVGLLKLADTFEVLDPATQQPVAVAREKPGAWIHLLRFILNKQMLPTRIVVREAGDPEEGRLLFHLRRGFNLVRSTVTVYDDQDVPIGYFRSRFKLFSLGGGFRVFDMDDREVARLDGDWKGWNFQFKGPNGEEIGVVTRQWGGLAKELFTSADTYRVSLTGAKGAPPTAKILLLAAALAIDIVFKEEA